MARVDLDAIRANYEYACRLAPDARAIAVIKADAYGHGAVAVARALADLTPAFAVGFLDEALELRRAGIREPVLLLQGVQDAGDLVTASEQHFAVVVHEERQLALLERARLTAPVDVWLKIDTGMHRLGLAPAAVSRAYTRLRATPNCSEAIVLCTHLATADQPDSAFTRSQLAAFDACTAGIDAPHSVASSGAILAVPEAQRAWTRPGYMLYGCSPFAQDLPVARALRPAMTLSAGIIGLRDVAAGDTIGYGRNWTAGRAARIATVAIGYGDGYPRHARNGTPTLVKGQVAPLAGTVSMDMIMIDVTGIDGVALGEAVTLWGPGLPVDAVARAAGTTGYELLTRVAARVPRRYVGG